MYGSDADDLDVLAAAIRSAADELDTEGTLLTRLLGNVSWIGDVALRYTADWTGVQLPTIGLSTRFLHEAADVLSRQAQEQREASGATAGRTGSPINGTLHGYEGNARSFESKGSPRADIIEAFWATGDGRRAEGDEIEVRQLANGRYAVVLPGVVDLTSNLDDFASGLVTGDAAGHWYDGDQPDTVRRMAYAIGEATDTADDFQNPYALKVIEVLREAGVPPGSDVMFIGHSFGAYTAMELAGNENFNSIDGSSAGYHVNVTHVLAAGADTSWKFAELPPDTDALVLNNRYDGAFRAEDPLVADGSPRTDGQLDIEFWGDKPWEKGNAAGHSPAGYVEFLEEATDRADLNAWLDRAASLYGGSGTAYSFRVEDFQ